jgi:phosphate:Na+ symporter
LPVLAGFAVFLFGMKVMELALYRWAGPYLQTALTRFTATPHHGMLTGTAATALLQSSTAVTVLTIGLVNAGLLTFPRTLGLVLGTNIGTCLTTELIGLSIAGFAVPLVVAALALWTFAVLLAQTPLQQQGVLTRHMKPLRHFAIVLLGFGLLLKGIAMMQSIAPAVQASPLFAWFLGQSGSGVLWGLAAGAVLTAAVHSSAAVIGIVMGLCSFGALPAETGIALVLGANVGTCVTALLAAVGGSPAGWFVAWSHVALNAGGALLFAPWVSELQAVTNWMTNDPAEQIARAQTLFNIVCSAAALPLCYLPIWRNRSSSSQPDDPPDANKAA